MAVDTKNRRRQSMRLKDYDYGSAGAYSVTICTRRRECVFGEVANERMILSDIGKIAEWCWNEIPHHFDHVELDCFVVMPNHLHGILFFMDHDERRGVQLNAPTRSNFYSQISPNKNTLPVVIRTFKAAVTRQCRLSGYDQFKWQRNYFDRIIRDEDELNRIREYIIYNPSKWQLDKENPENL